MKKATIDGRRGDEVWSAMRDFDVTTMMAGGERGVKAMAEAQERFIARIAAMNREIAGFIDRRLTHDRETIHALAECKSPHECVTVWGKFVETASREYAEECGKIAGLGIEEVQNPADESQPETAGGTTPGVSGGTHG